MMKVARFLSKKTIKFEDAPIPQVASKELLVKVQASGICGTDLHIYEGKIQGLAKPNIILGHEFSGIVEDVGSDVTSYQIKDRVAIEPNLFCGTCHFCRNAKKHFCENWEAIGLTRDGGFAEYCLVPASSAYHLPKELDFKIAAFFEPMACVLHGIENGRIKIGDIVVVQGVGSIGQLFVQTLNNLGVSKIIAVDIDDSKLHLAKRFGATRIINVKREDLHQIVHEETNGYGANVMIDSAGLLNTIPTGLKILKSTGRLVIFGVPPEDESVSIRPYDIYRREISIVGSFTNPYTNEAALEMLKKLDVKPLITNSINLESLVEEGFKKMKNPGMLKTQIVF